MNAKEAVFVLALAATLLVVVVNSAQAQLFSSSAELDQRSLGELVQAVETSTINMKNKVKYKEMKQKVGRAFWNDCFKYRVLDMKLLPNLASLGSACGDVPGKADVFEEGGKGLTQDNCSYTSPKGSELVAVLNLKGSKKCVTFGFDSRNWKNYGKQGVLIAWSEGGLEFMTGDIANEQWKVDEASWDHPESQVIGQRKPFERTHQHEECSAFVKPEVEKDDTDYCTLFKKLERAWTFKATRRAKGKEQVQFVKFKVVMAAEKECWLDSEDFDEKSQPIAGSKKRQSLDPANKQNGRPPRGIRIKDSAKEVEAAGRKWKVEKWTSVQSGQTFDYWMSTEIPGLTILVEPEEDGTRIELTEFIEGE